MQQYGNADDDDDKSSASMGSMNEGEGEAEPDLGSLEADSVGRQDEPKSGGKSR